MPIVRGPTASDRERRSAAAAACGVRVLESEPRLLEVALVVQRDAVQILSAEAVHEAAHTCALDDDVVLARLVFDIEAIAEPRAPAGEHRDRSEEHTSELQSHSDLVCRLLLEKKKT